MGKRPVKSVYSVPSTVLARSAQQKISHDASFSLGGLLSSVDLLMLLSIGACFRVDCRFFHCRCRCPFIVAVDFGKCLMMACVLRPGKPSNWLFFTAFISVDFVGENKHWCRYCISCFWFFACCMLLICCVVDVRFFLVMSRSCFRWWSGTSHSFVIGHFCPYIIILPS